MPAETRYMCAYYRETTNGLDAFALDLAYELEDIIEINVGSATGTPTAYYGIKVFKRNAAGDETEITSGVSAIVSYPYGASAYSTRSATWDCPETALEATDSIVVRVYADVDVNPPTTLRTTFTTEQLGASKLDAVTWTVWYRVRRVRTGVSPNYTYTFYYRYGTVGDDSLIDNFTWTPAVAVVHELQGDGITFVMT